MFYGNQDVLLASKHEKEKAIAVAFRELLNLRLCVEPFDTDQFGTFSGEIERKLTPYSTCVKKAKTAAQIFDYQLAVASEGSFGPHPVFPFVAADEEIMVFVDLKNDWVIAEKLVSEKTNYSMMRINSTTRLDEFLRQARFPEHALIVQTLQSKTNVAKGIRDSKSLKEALALGFEQESDLLLTTDMRAMMNPMRMELIKELACKLAGRVAKSCPGCNAPGFGFKGIRGSLPCEFCTGETSLHQYEIDGCIRCDYEEVKPRADGMFTTSPQYCFTCNP